MSDVLPVLDPSLQVSFYYRLKTLRGIYFREALARTVAELEVPAIDRELAELVPAEALGLVARAGLRGEVIFPVPVIISSSPFLLGYYRLLLGFSQKEFYSKGPFGRFKRLEDAGKLHSKSDEEISRLCTSLIGSASRLVSALDPLSLDLIHELQVLTVGPQFRGGENNRVGQRATEEIRKLISALVNANTQEATPTSIVLRNDSDRIVFIEFFSDPDVRVTEQLTTGVRPTLSIEIKGGVDASNIHNRLGEAEKSHQKARVLGFREFWTIMAVDLDEAVARRDSPTTSRFWRMSSILDPSDPEHQDFKELFCSYVGIRGDLA